MAYTKNFTSLQERLDELGEDFVFVEEDVSNITTNLPGVFTQVQALLSRVGALEHGHAPPPLVLSGGLTTASMILDDVTGVPIASVGQLFQKLVILEKENATMRAEIGSQGGVMVGTFMLPSKGALDVLIREELPIGGLMLFDLFVDIGTLHCHNPNVDPGNSSSSLLD